MENEQLLKEYAEVCIKEKEIADKKEELKTKLEEAFGQNPVVEKTRYGTFTMVARTSYEFSPKVKAVQEDLKMMMEDEKEQGVAVPTVSYGLRFNAPKQ